MVCMYMLAKFWIIGIQSTGGKNLIIFMGIYVVHTLIMNRKLTRIMGRKMCTSSDITGHW